MMDFQKYVEHQSFLKDCQLRKEIYKVVRKYGLKPCFNTQKKEIFFRGVANLQSWEIYFVVSGGHGSYAIELAVEAWGNQANGLEEYVSEVYQVTDVLKQVDDMIQKYA